MINFITEEIKKENSWISFLLIPFSWVYRLVFFLKLTLSSPKKIDAKVICVGNVIAGGAGKTPLVIKIAKATKNCAIVLRGYGGSLSGGEPVRVDLNKHTFKEVGDEAVMHASIAPTYICRDRYKAALLAQKDGAKVIIMDDGFQNFSLQKDHAILVFDSEFGIGNNRVLPAGLLRESVSSALKRADELVLLSYDGKYKKPFEGKFTEYRVEVLNPKLFKGKRFVALCGIGNPNKFFKSLKSIKVDVIKKFTFPDHHVYSLNELDEIISYAKKEKCKIVTTSKDYLKIDKKMQKHFMVLEIGLIDS